MNNWIGRATGWTLALTGALATLSVLTVAGIKMGDRLIYHIHLEPFSRAEQRCSGLGRADLADTPERHACLRAELANLRESVWKGTLPYFLAALVTGVTAIGGLALAAAGNRLR